MESTPKTKVLVLIPWYLPAYKAGGPITSISHLVGALADDTGIKILTTDEDIHGEKLHVTSDVWHDVNGASVYYAIREKLSVLSFIRLLKSIDSTAVYVNGIFSWYFAILPLIFKKHLKGKIVVAPRGMLQAGALKSKRTKKKLAIFCFRLMGMFRNVHFHATDEIESSDISDNLKVSQDSITIIPNLVCKPPLKTVHIKTSGTLRMLYYSRIDNKKNLIFLLQLLANLHVEDWKLDIFGSISNPGYWNECMAWILKVDANGDKITYHGPVHPSEIKTIMDSVHISVLPTRGENFGHTIYESLCHAVPVLISDKTPWKDLEENQAGWVKSLDNPNGFLSVLQEVAEMDQHQYDSWSSQAWKYANSVHRAQQRHIRAYHRMFAN